MKLWSGHYLDPECLTGLIAACAEHFPEPDRLRLICIGSTKNIPDCWGPICGSLIQKSVPALEVQGTLAHPWHAANHRQRLRALSTAPSKVNCVIDAGSGQEKLGTLLLRSGHLYPGKASGKNLTPLGDINLTAVTAPKPKTFLKMQTHLALHQVYLLAQLLNQAIDAWYRTAVSLGKK